MTTYNTTGNATPDPDPDPHAPAPAAVASFLASLPTDLRSATPTLIGASGSTFALKGSVGVVAPGATVEVAASARAALYIGDGSKVDLSSSAKADGTPVHLDVAVGGGANTLVLNRGPSVARSTDGNDTIRSSGGHDQLYGGFGQDSLVGGGRSLVVGGVAGGDTLVGGLNAAAQDTIASQGAAHIRTALGNNLVMGGAADTINAGQAADTVYAADGAATVRGGSGALTYGSGRSSILAGGGKNNTFSLTGDDTLVAGRGAAVVDLGDSGRASVHGGVGHLDVNVADRTGNDTLFGGAGGLTIHIAAGAGAIVNDPNTLDAGGRHVVQLAGGETLHVSNVTIDFGDGQHKVL